MVKGFARRADEVAGGDAHRTVFAFGEFERGTVYGRRHLDTAPGEIDPAAGHQVDSGGARGVGGEMLGQFVGCDDRGPVKAGERHGIADVVLVSVAAEHVIAGDRGGIDRAVGIFGEVGIEDEPRAGHLDEEAGVAEVGQAHAGGKTIAGGSRREGGLRGHGA